MNQNDLLFNNIAQYMELLSKLSEDIPDALFGLSQLCVDTLLAGGKLIVVTDDISRSGGTHFCQAMTHGETIERPALPTINFRNISQTAGIPENDLLHHITAEKDLVIVMTEKVENVPLELIPEQSLVMTPGSESHPTTPTLCLNMASRGQWLFSLTVIINTLSEQIEKQLFGYQS